MRNWSREPAQRLRPFVQRYLATELAGVEPGVHHSLPSPYLTFIISLDEPIEVVQVPDGNRHGCAFPAVIGGLQTAAASVRHGTSLRIIRVLLSPVSARAVFGVRAAEIASGVFGVAEILGRRGGEMLERLIDAGSWTQRFDVLDEVLTSRLEDRAAVPVPLQRAWRGIASTAGELRVDALARDVGWSRRHLTEQFAHEFGLTPKVAMRVARLDRVRQQLQAGGESLSAVAAVSSYVDQAHLTREWRQFAGSSPSAWLAAEHLPNLQDVQVSDPPQ